MVDSFSGHRGLVVGSRILAGILVLVLSACGGGGAYSLSGSASSLSVPTAASASGSVRVAHALSMAVNGSSGLPFTDPLASNEVATGLTICWGWAVDSLTVQTNVRTHPLLGGSGGSQCQSLHFASGEQIVRISGMGDNAGLYTLSITTSLGHVYGPYGAGYGNTLLPSPYVNVGSPFSSTIQNGVTGRFAGFSGIAGDLPGLLTPAIEQLNLIDAANGSRTGVDFVDRMKVYEQLTGITICYNAAGPVQSVQLHSSLGVYPQHGSTWPGLPCVTTQLSSGEYITEIDGTADTYVNSLGFKTSTGRVVAPLGSSSGLPFIETVAAGQFVGLYGNADTWLNAVGLLTPEVGNTTDPPFFDQLPLGQTINDVRVCTGVLNGMLGVQSIQSFYNQGASSLPLHGGKTVAGVTACSDAMLDAGDFIVQASGTYTGLALANISFTTHQGKMLGPYGGPNGVSAFVIRNPNSSQFLGFYGHALETGINPTNLGDTTLNGVGYVSGLAFMAPDVFPPVAAPTASAATQGWWSDVVAWPLLGLHSAVTPDGRVMSFGTDGSGYQGAQFIFDVWDPTLGVGSTAHLTLPNTLGTDIFCSAQTLLSSGDLLMAGGDDRTNGVVNAGTKNATLFKLSTNSLQALPNMNYARWYATQSTMASGRVFVAGGLDSGYVPSVTPEIYTPGLGWKSLPGMSSLAAFGMFYPRVFNSLGTTVGAADQAYAIATLGQGEIYLLHPDDQNGAGGIYDTGVNLGGTYSWFSPAAMVAPNLVLVALDSGKTVLVSLPTAPGQAPVVSPAGTMSQARAWANFTVLPTGEVLATNGSSQANELTSTIAYQAEIWNPSTKTWRTVAAELVPRLYHSNSLLLQDGTVLSGAGGAGSGSPQANLNAQIYTPYYLFNSSGALAPRPSITYAPTQVLGYGSAPFSISSSDTSQIARVTLLRLGSATHSFNAEQRFMNLNFSTIDGSHLNVYAPTDAHIAPPGYYFLTVIDVHGVPSKSVIVRLG